MAIKKPKKQAAKKVKVTQKGVQFQFSAPQAREVFVAGEFNNWDTRANPMAKDENGMWTVIIPLAPGRYEYRFLSDGNWENDCLCSGCVPNSFGSLNCVKMVE